LQQVSLFLTFCQSIFHPDSRFAHFRLGLSPVDCGQSRLFLVCADKAEGTEAVLQIPQSRSDERLQRSRLGPDRSEVDVQLAVGMSKRSK